MKPSGIFFLQELTSRLIATDHSVVKTPSALSFMAVHKQAAASAFARPWSRAQHLLPIASPATKLATSPIKSAQTPNLRASLGQKGFGGGSLGGMNLGWNALERVERRERRRKVGMVLLDMVRFLVWVVM